MPSIKAQKVRYDDNGNIVSGSAAIIDTVYVSTGRKDHSRKETREKLCKVLYLSDDKRSGIFRSPTRGLVEYDSNEDAFAEVDRDDPRINTEKVFPGPEIHTVFGDSYLDVPESTLKLKKPGISMSELPGKTQSLMCRKSKEQIHIETPNKQVRQYYSYPGMKAPAHIKLTSYTEQIHGSKM